MSPKKDIAPVIVVLAVVRVIVVVVEEEVVVVVAEVLTAEASATVHWLKLGGKAAGQRSPMAVGKFATM